MNVATRYKSRSLPETLYTQGRKARWLASEVGVSESLISKIGSGARFADNLLAERISKVLGVPIGLLFELQERSDLVTATEEAAA